MKSIVGLPALFLIIALMAVPALEAAPPTNAKLCFEYENDSCYTTAAEACEAVARTRRADPLVEDPYGRVIASKDAGDSFWCKLADKNGNENEQHYGSKRLSGPEKPSSDQNAVQAKPAQKDKTKSDETCEEKHKEITECNVYERQGMTLASKESAQKILAKLNPGKRLEPGPMTEAEMCENNGEHWNYYVKKRFVGSILGCKCCRNTNSGPVIDSRYKASH